MLGFEYLIAPHSKEKFIEKYWGKRAVFMPNSADRFESLFGWGEVNHHLNHTRQNYDGMRLAHETKVLGPNEFAKVDYWLQEGATFIINNVNRIDEVTEQFAEMLSCDLNTPVNINCYASCPSKQGFDVHFDLHDVFIIQTEGTKKWAVFEPTIQSPLYIQNPEKGEPPTSDPYIECEMSVGDVLYIPRGHWHYAVATSPSIHLTVGPSSVSGAEFLNWISKQLTNNDEFFRKDFPVADASMFGGEQSSQALNEHLNEFRSKIKEILDGASFQEAFIRFCTSSNPLKRQSELPSVWTLDDDISQDTLFELPSTQKTVIRYDDENASSVIYLRGEKINLENIPKPLIQAIFEPNQGEFCGREILKKCEAEKIDWIRVRDLLLLLAKNFGIIRLVS